MTRHLGVLLDWTVVDFAFLGIAIQQYISISRDLKRTRAQAAEGALQEPFFEKSGAKTFGTSEPGAFNTRGPES